ncbi:Alpha-mannosidase 2C1 [Geranomyces variabilis]|uniref:Alpha-mannosidase n=1 Tax=Geranomyces variabilis TaxID=109894 RepID=A0AAD5XKN7_9FUNG|nr:Alpha-mannosidase 2C1 [Geranomyces variabilis]
MTSARSPHSLPLNGMQKHRDITVSRIQSFLAGNHQFADVGLASALVESRYSDAVCLSVFAVPNVQRIPFSEAIKGKFSPVKVGHVLEPVWSTHWFNVKIKIPSALAGKEVDLVFDPGCEGLIWSTDGEPLMGITGANNGDRHVDFRLSSKASGKETLEFYIEVSCNGMFGAGAGGNGSIQPPEASRKYTLQTCELRANNKLAREVQRDLDVIFSIGQETPKDSQTSSDAIYAANAVVNAFRYDDLGTLEECKRITTEFLAARANTGYAQHVITAVGNCHIDTAWLWPYDETKRKCARSWATQCGLLEEYDEYTFAASQAQQFEWTEQLYPKLFERIKRHAKTGRFIPIGGTWVEMDCNIPSGEALCRQFLYGQRYFEKTFGERSKVFWLPDTFGYSCQLPQIIHDADMKYFFTQKLSWNNINKFPHTSFMWTGLDGTSVLTHFSPVDTYTSQATVRDVVFAVQNNKDKSYSNKSLLLYGNGDGGGGPLVAMLERLRRMSRVEGLPAVVKMDTPNAFYEDLEKTSKDLVTWKGELYLEFHRGTYTSHARVKQFNRSSELLLRKIEILSALCLASGAKDYKHPKEELDRLWKLCLLNQFHDVLPGSSIGMVYVDAIKFYEDIATRGAMLAEAALRKLIDVSGSGSNVSGTSSNGSVVFNPLSWTRPVQVIEIPLAISNAASFRQLSACGTKGLQLIGPVPGYALEKSLFDQSAQATALSVHMSDETVVVSNEHLVLTLNKCGRILSLLDRTANDREAIAPGFAGNIFRLYEDIPLFWDAWDVEVYHLEKGWDAGVGTLSLVENGPLRIVLEVKHPLTPTSTLTQKIILCTGSKRVEFENHVVWNENRRILKVEFPVNVDNDSATYETQFGFIRRPTHYNTSWDLARFEVCAHKWVDLSECGYGVALLNESKYGFAVHNNVISMSILRAPKAPDANCDIGEHNFSYALYPHKGSLTESDVVQAAYEFNVPLIAGIPAIPADFPPCQFFKVDTANLVLDTVKVAEDGDALVLRLYESCGGRGAAKLSIHPKLGIDSAHFCNVLEDVQSAADITGGVLTIPFTPFKIISIKVMLKARA